MYKVTIGAVPLVLILVGCASTSPEAVKNEQEPQIINVELFDESDKRIRADFAVQLKKIKEGQSKEEVRELLGEPDVSYFAGTGDRYTVGTEIWLYGSPHKYELPVLGRVIFVDEQVFYGSGTHALSLELPDELELRKALRLMYSSAPKNWTLNIDPLHMIRVANHLIPMGKSKAVATITEYSVVDLAYTDWLFWLVQSMFEIPEDPGYMRSPRIGGYGPGGYDKKSFPRYPTILLEDIPFVLFNGATLSGIPESFGGYFKEISKQEMRKELFRPEDDPFDTLSQLWASDSWPFPIEEDLEYSARWELDYNLLTLQQTVDLVRTVYHPSETVPYYAEDESDLMAYFEKCHSEFLALGAVWNSEKQMYTLIDGSVPYPLNEIYGVLVAVSDAEKVKSAKNELLNLTKALEMFRIDIGRYPTTEEGLFDLRKELYYGKNWKGPYLPDDVPLDPWDNAYYYKHLEGEDNFILLSFGADCVEGGEGFDADIYYFGDL